MAFSFLRKLKILPFHTVIQVETGDEWEAPLKEPEDSEDETTGQEDSRRSAAVTADLLRDQCCEMLEAVGARGYTMTLQRIRRYNPGESPFLHPLMENCTEGWFTGNCTRDNILSVFHDSASILRPEALRILNYDQSRLTFEELFFFRLCSLVLDTGLWPEPEAELVMEESSETFNVSGALHSTPPPEARKRIEQQEERMASEPGEEWWHSCAAVSFWPDALLGIGFSEVYPLLSLILGEKHASSLATSVFAVARSKTDPDDCIIL